MIEVEVAPLSEFARTKLLQYQAFVDTGVDYADRITRAKSQFRIANTASSQVFRDVKKKLTASCSGARRCMYCEDSVADEVEHHHPKDLYPELTFKWKNYLYACGPCNGPKNSKFAIIVGKSIVNVSRPPTAPVTKPRKGPSALIEPRREDPLAMLLLDILGDTFRFTPHPTAPALLQDRAHYTIDILGLNRRDYLLAARREAFHNYLSRLRQYNQTKQDKKLWPSLEFQYNAIIHMQHPTVFREMIRQSNYIPALAEIVALSPEMSAW